MFLRNFSKRSIDTARETLKAWEIVYEGFDPQGEKLRETLCTLGNGYMGVRGAGAESRASEIHYPAIYTAGIYNTLATNISGKKIYNEDLVNCPNCLFLSFQVNKKVWDLSLIHI